MAGPQPRKAASTNRQGTGGKAVAAALERYARDLERAPLAARTRDAYAQHVAAYGAWLGERPGGEAALEDPRARDYAARDFKRWLKGERRWKARVGEPRAGGGRPLQPVSRARAGEREA
ncbi:MAG: hypothetical protein LC777_00585 [Actinobacteria bacterium]|nr:hypothetical protein [Actinomycetota bacterium]